MSSDRCLRLVQLWLGYGYSLRGEYSAVHPRSLHSHAFTYNPCRTVSSPVYDQYQPDKPKPVHEPEIIAHNGEGLLHDLLKPVGQLMPDHHKDHHHHDGKNEQDMVKSMQIMNEAGASPADVVCWSGCLDTQTVS